MPPVSGALFPHVLAPGLMYHDGEDADVSWPPFLRLRRAFHLAALGPPDAAPAGEEDRLAKKKRYLRHPFLARV